MGEFPGSFTDGDLLHTVVPTALDNVANGQLGEFIDRQSAYSYTGNVRVGCKLIYKGWLGRMERMDCLRGYCDCSVCFAGFGSSLQGEENEGQETGETGETCGATGDSE